jgi:hypothetical protein
MPGQLAAKLVELGFTSHWPLGEVAGDNLDAIGSVDLGPEGGLTRNVAALNDEGDGCMTWDGISAVTDIPATAVINDIFMGGGTLFCLFNAHSDGVGNEGRIWQKQNRLWVQDEAGGFVRLQFTGQFGSANGIWQTAVDIPITTPIVLALAYTHDGIADNPTMFIHDGTSQTTRTVGAGLTEVGTPNGTPSSDAAVQMGIGAIASSRGNTFDGEIDEVALKNDGEISEAQATELIDLALQEAAAAGGEGPVGGIGQMAGNAPHSFRTRMVGT